MPWQGDFDRRGFLHDVSSGMLPDGTVSFTYYRISDYAVLVQGVGRVGMSRVSR